MKKTISYLLLPLLGLFLFVGCNPTKEEKSLKGSSIELQKNWAYNIITPAFTSYQKEVALLDQAAQTFAKEINQENLDKLKEVFLLSYKAYQKVSIFEFGFAEKIYFVPMSNTYPCNTDKIKEKIDLIIAGKEAEIILKTTSKESEYVYQGYPALDYLLFDKEYELSYYKGAKGKATAKYISKLTAFMKETIDMIVDRWKSWVPEYVEDVDDSSTGAYAATINAFVRTYEKAIRADKVGYAAGAINNQMGKPAPKVIEAYYNGTIDKELLLIALHSSQDFFNGIAFESKQKGKGLADILKEFKQAALVDKINQQYKEIYALIEDMPMSLKETAVKDNPQMRKLFNALQVNVVNYKTHMLTALSVSVGYKDSDGD